jgi:multiple sugar transport system ATP-binding protein
VALGRAIVRDPKAFLMDEPLSNLDAKLRVQMRTEISRLQNKLRTTTVYVTHDQTEAMTLGDRVAVMRAGRIQQVGTPAELYNQPANIFVAGFIGSPAMNFLPVTFTNGTLRTPFGTIAPDDRQRRAMEASGAHATAILGVRPENFEDAMILPRPAGRGLRFSTTVEVLEPLGSDTYAYFALRNGSLQGSDPDRRGQGTAIGTISGDAGQVVARLDAASGIREGQRADLWVDIDRTHLFDPESGRTLTL